MTLPKDALRRRRQAGGWTGYVGSTMSTPPPLPFFCPRPAVDPHAPTTYQRRPLRHGADPKGPSFSLFKPNGDMQRPADDPNKPGSSAARDLCGRRRDFFSPSTADLFGWTKRRRCDMGEMASITDIRPSLLARRFGGIWKPAARRDRCPSGNYYFRSMASRRDVLFPGGRRHRDQRYDGSARRKWIVRASPAGRDVLPGERQAGAPLSSCETFYGCGRAGCARGQTRAQPQLIGDGFISTFPFLPPPGFCAV